MTRKGVEFLLDKARTVQKNSPEILRPIEKFFDVDLQERLHNDRYWRDLCYDSY
jgi:hypothetical protein